MPVRVVGEKAICHTWEMYEKYDFHKFITHTYILNTINDDDAAGKICVLTG